MFFYMSESQLSVRTNIKNQVEKRVAKLHVYGSSRGFDRNWLHYTHDDAFEKRFLADDTLDLLRVLGKFFEKGEMPSIMPQPVGQTAAGALVDPMTQIPSTMFQLYGYATLLECKSLFVPSRFMLSSVLDTKTRSSMPESVIVKALATNLGHEANYQKEWRDKVVARGKHKGKMRYDLGLKNERPLASKWRFPQTAAHPNFKQLQQKASKAVNLLFIFAGHFERCSINVLSLEGEDRLS